MRHSGFLFLALISAFSLRAQDLPSENITVIKNFEAQLAEATRVDLTPSTPSPDTFRQTQTYILPMRSLSVNYPPPKIKPIAMKGDKLAEAFKGYARLGGGWPNSIIGDASYNVFVQDKYDIGFELFHHSANNNKRLSNQKFSNSGLGLDGTYYFPQGFAVNGNFGYTHDVVHFYAYNFDPDLAGRPIVDEDVRQRFNVFDVSASIFNGERTVGDFNYSAGFDFYWLLDNYASSERGFDLTLSGTKWFAEKHSLDIVLITDFTNFEDTTTQNLHNFFLQPAFTYHSDVMSVKLGAKGGFS